MDEIAVSHPPITHLPVSEKNVNLLILNLSFAIAADPDPTSLMEKQNCKEYWLLSSRMHLETLIPGTLCKHPYNIKPILTLDFLRNLS